MIMAMLALRERETVAGQKPSPARAGRHVVRPQSETHANARLKDARAVHPAVIGIAIFAAFWFAFAAWVGFAGDKEAARSHELTPSSPGASGRGQDAER